MSEMIKLNNLYYLVTKSLECYYQSGLTTYRDKATLTYYKYKKLKGKKTIEFLENILKENNIQYQKRK